MLFRLSNVTKTYGNITALRQLTVEVAPGAVGLLGPNGAGKTTLIRTMLGLIGVDSGSGEILGMDIRGHIVRTLWIEHASDIATEYYAAVVLDRSAKRPLVMFSVEGGLPCSHRSALVTCPVTRPTNSRPAL